ncbi:MAG: hypothetical protein ACOY6K_12555 [Pseudomonadota bacterium]
MSLIDKLTARIEELEALCGIPSEASYNPFVGQHRRRLHIIAGLLIKRDRVNYEAIGLAVGVKDGAMSGNCAAMYVSHLRKQLPDDIKVLCEFGVGYYVNDKARLAAFLREPAQ